MEGMKMAANGECNVKSFELMTYDDLSRSAEKVGHHSSDNGSSAEEVLGLSRALNENWIRLVERRFKGLQGQLITTDKCVSNLYTLWRTLDGTGIKKENGNVPLIIVSRKIDEIYKASFREEGGDSDAVSDDILLSQLELIKQYTELIATASRLIGEKMNGNTGWNKVIENSDLDCPLVRFLRSCQLNCDNHFAQEPHNRFDDILSKSSILTGRSDSNSNTSQMGKESSEAHDTKGESQIAHARDIPITLPEVRNARARLTDNRKYVSITWEWPNNVREVRVDLCHNGRPTESKCFSRIESCKMDCEFEVHGYEDSVVITSINRPVEEVVDSKSRPVQVRWPGYRGCLYWGIGFCPSGSKSLFDLLSSPYGVWVKCDDRLEGQVSVIVQNETMQNAPSFKVDVNGGTVKFPDGFGKSGDKVKICVPEGFVARCDTNILIP